MGFEGPFQSAVRRLVARELEPTLALLERIEALLGSAPVIVDEVKLLPMAVRAPRGRARAGRPAAEQAREGTVAGDEAARELSAIAARAAEPIREPDAASLPRGTPVTVRDARGEWTGSVMRRVPDGRYVVERDADLSRVLVEPDQIAGAE